MSSILTYLLASGLYAALAFYFWHRYWRAADHAATRLGNGVYEHIAILVPLALHGALLYGALFAEGGLRLGVGNAISAIVWLTVLIYWLGSFFYRLHGLHALIAPVAAVAVLLPMVFPSLKAIPNTELMAFKAHLLISLLAYSLFTIASLHVLLMAILERRLHAGTLPPTLSNMPPLLSMESLLFRIILAGFILLTLTLASGVIFSEELFGKAARFSHKTVFGVISWLIFGALLIGRHVYGWRGRTAVRWTLAGFLALVLAYIGSKFVVEIILGR